MLYDRTPVGRICFRISVGGEEYVEKDFYEQVKDENGKISMIAHSWVFPTPQTITPTQCDVDVPESLRSSLFMHEAGFDKACRRHRRTRAVSFPTPPMSPGNSESLLRSRVASLPSPLLLSTSSTPLHAITEETDGTFEDYNPWEATLSHRDAEAEQEKDSSL
ncbi:hypothetical protein NA57DRAFT_74070 [Rhizodiscina lignyota]|uniref:Uncharacterized protein n=1 Tax=Rhizodiscina lignyota TaxID=1504668 RepID=A0A9P4IES8_9PEZI|nr:hypothetical protein NA57DRAFT_74070 [Rhizodiscina lignyota]